MNVTVAAVISADAKLTRHGEANVHSWASEEDQAHLHKLVAEHDSIVFGSGTYEAMGGKFNLEAGKLRIVLTHEPDKYAQATVPDQLEFMTLPIPDLIPYLEKRGKQNLLVAGGPHMIAEFLKAKLVDQIYLTIEPRLFGSGKNLLPDVTLDVRLKLTNVETLNQQGTILAHYQVIR